MALSDWMSGLDDLTCITNLAIPGTHDSGAFEYCSTPMTQAHGNKPERNFRNQLNIGVRALDIRCGRHGYVWGGDYYIYHGPIGFNTKIQSVIDDVVSFLADNPKEFVILVLKQESGSTDISDAINKIVNDTLDKLAPNDRLYKFDNTVKEWPTLGVLRGKVIVLNRLKSKRDGGTGAGHYDVGGWTGNPDRLIIKIPPNNLEICLQDKWDGPTLIVKQKAIKDLLDEAKREATAINKTCLYVNFLSYSKKGMDSPVTFGKNTNDWLIGNCKEGKGVICVDAVDEKITQHIIDMNK